VYYILVDGECHATEDFWEEALITAAQTDFMFNSPEMNNGEIGKRAIEIKEQK
jgi:hypothetical protein